MGKDFMDHAPGVADAYGVGVQVVRDEDQRDGQCPAATSRPSRVIDVRRCTEHVAAVAGEEVPRDDQVTSGITHAQTTEVDDGAPPGSIRCRATTNPARSVAA
jgi:hypothetical protein